MTTLELNLSDEMLERLQSEAERRNMPLDKLVSEAIEYYLEEDIEFEDEDEATILEDLRQSLKEVLAGNTYPARDLLTKKEKADSVNAD
jgi:predicted DNA-binding protein